MQLPLAEPSKVAIRRVHAVVNPASGSLGPGAAQELAAVLAERGLEHRVISLEPGGCEQMVRAAVDGGPDLVVVLGGDGTARLVAEICGPQGPLVAPLSGGTMNMLGRAIYGPKPWREALMDALERGAPRWAPGGEIGGRGFYCGAVLGSPALLARAREAIRARKLGRAWRGAVISSRKAFLSRLSYRLNGHAGEGVALSLLCPTASRAPDEHPEALKAAVLDRPGEGARASIRLALSNLIGDWRHDPAGAMPCVSGRAWARTPIPIMLDGEFFRLGRAVDIRFQPQAFRVLAPSQEADGGQASGGLLQGLCT